MRRALISITVAVALSLPVAADASHVACRQILTQDTTLDSDVDCQTVAAPGLQLGASDITLDMNGYTLRNPPGTNALTGIRNLNGHDGVRVLNGKVEGFALGVDLLSADSRCDRGSWPPRCRLRVCRSFAGATA